MTDAQPSSAQQLIGDFAPKLVSLTDDVLFGDPHSTPWHRVPVWKIGSAVRNSSAGTPVLAIGSGRYGMADRWSLSRMARLRAASFDSRLIRQ
jgi:hypothetical protein